MKTFDFIPGTTVRPVGRGVVFRPIRSWHSGTYAGERLSRIEGSTDRSGCVWKADGRAACSPPMTVTHRIYWNARDPERHVSAFLSYPNGMGCCDTYFWEANIDAPGETDGGGISRYETEEECEAAILAVLGDAVPT